MEQLSQLIEQYGIYAVFVLCTVEGDITLLLSGAMAHSSFFGDYSFIKIFIAGTLGGMVGDSFGYMIGRVFHEKAKHYRFYQMAQPRIERLIDKFGGFAIIISKYIYGIRAGMCLFYGIAKTPFWRFLMLDAISCATWVLVLAGSGYFFSGAITSILGNFKQVGISLFFVVLVGIIIFYVVERYWLSEKVEEVTPETLHKIEERIQVLEDVAQEKLHGLGERLHLTSPKGDEDAPKPKEKAAGASKE
ncbi:MAG: DedA family protein [Acidobacteria bacterium]|nr:DedA family protein [Acidobacteriota bacterium]MBK8147582.1 DedA family protein [Acidobacteriota bacterium]MBK8809607.1 DedA family protein [Acidobacteriota bacterium]